MEMNMTSGFNFTNSTATFEPSVAGLMALTVIIWIYLFTGLAALWFLIIIHRDGETDWADEFPLVIGCRRKYRSKSTYAHLITGIIVTGMIVTPLTLVVGGVLSQQNGNYNQTQGNYNQTRDNSNETAELTTEGFTGLVLLIVSAVVQLLVWTVAFAAAAHGILGCRCVCGCASAFACVFGTFFMANVAFLGWSSLGFDTVQVTNDTDSSSFDLTAIPGTSVLELMIFAAISWSTTLPAPVVTWYAYQGQFGDTKEAGKVAILTAVVIGIPPLSLVAGSVLSLLNGDSLGLSAEGITGRVLLILTGVISILIWVAIFTATVCMLIDGKCKSFFAITPGYVITSVFVIGVALLGQTSFEIDTVPMNGSNSTVTTELHTAGVVISSLGLVLPFLVSVVLACIGCIACVGICIETLYCVEDANEWVAEVRDRRRKTKGTEEARLHLSKSLLEEALKHGFVTCRTVVCLLVGVAGAGKTHTKHLLFGWAPPKYRNSTPLAVRPVQAIRVQVPTQSGQLQEVDPDQLDKVLACTVAKGAFLENVNFIHKLCCSWTKKQTKSRGISAPSKDRSINDSPSRESTSHRKGFCHCCNGSDSELQQTAKSALDKTARQIADTSEPQQFLDCDWIYLIDSGGQIEFLEVMPAFLQLTSVCLFVTKLSEMLSEHPKIEYFDKGNPVGKPTLCPFTNKQMLMRCVQTIKSQCIDQVGSSNKGSQLVMVGTHRDLEHQCLESREEKNQRLRELLCKFKQSLVYHGQGMEELIFPINAKNPGPQDHEVGSEITKVIMRAASSLKPRKTPISWFKFEQYIMKTAKDQERKIMHRKECLQIARLFYLSKKDLDAALDHLSSFSVIHYYPHLLPDVVFVDPQFLLDKISELVKFCYKLRHDPDPHTATRGDLQKFKDEGCITLKLLNQFSDQYTNYFTPADFLKLMNDRLIVTHLIDDEEYFMPSLLRTMESREVDLYRITASGVAPLAIHFSCGWVPHGVFCSLVAFLQSSQNSSPWRLSLWPADPTKPWCLTRNCIKFQFPGAPGSVTLIDAFSHFEVHVDAPCEVCVRLCPSIQQSLLWGIQKVAETLRYTQLVPKLAFLCKHENKQPHLALPTDAFDYWKCEINPETQFGPLTNGHKMWKDGSTTDWPPTHPTVQLTTSLPTGQQHRTYQAQPSQMQQQSQLGQLQQPSGCLTAQDLHMLTFIMKAAAAEWKTIGDALGFLDSDLTLIQRTPMLIPEGPIGYFREMLSQWLKWAPPNHPWPTLEALRNALQSSGQESLALQLRLQKEGKVGLTSSCAGAAVPLTQSTMQQTSSQTIRQQQNTCHQPSELGYELQQLQFSQVQQPTVEESPNTTFGLTTDISSATAVPRMHPPAEHIIPLPSTYQALPPQLWQQPQMATPDKLQRSPGLEEMTKSVQRSLPGAEVKSKLNSAECQAFQSCFTVLCNGISDPGWLASLLYSRDMISRDINQEARLEALAAPTRTRKLLSAVENQIVTSPTSKFGDFLDILYNEPSLEHLARKLEEAYTQVLKEHMKPLVASDYEVDAGISGSTAEVHAVLEVHSEVDEDCPTVLECAKFRGRKRTINIPQEIGSSYFYFGLRLLDDPNGTRVRSIEHEYRETEWINTQIIQQWATGRGKKPVTWKTLTEVLHDIELHSLASEIETVKLL